jgi:hypothetical protein
VIDGQAFTTPQVLFENQKTGAFFDGALSLLNGGVVGACDSRTGSSFGWKGRVKVVVGKPANVVESGCGGVEQNVSQMALPTAIRKSETSEPRCGLFPSYRASFLELTPKLELWSC